MKKRSNGRPRGSGTTLTPELLKAFRDFAAAGVPFEATAGVLHVSRAAAYGWLSKAREDEAKGVQSLYRAFADAVLHGRAQAEASAARAFYGAHESDWRAAQAWLICRHPERWNPRTVVEHAGRIEAAVDVKHLELRHEVAQIKELLATDESAALADRIVAALVERDRHKLNGAGSGVY